MRISASLYSLACVARTDTLCVPLLAVTVLAGCGGSDSSSSGDKTSDSRQQAANGSARCIESWNAASKDVRAQASLSHRGDEPKDVYIGTYAGKAFKESGDAYDASGSPTSAEVSVAPGDCAAVDRTGTSDAETNWVMVAPKASGGGKSWYFLDETGSHPLAKSPQPLDGQATVRIMGFGEEAKLVP
jgi:hypothetical protein